ncbi:MAG: hypothetical protein AB7S64_05450 [Bacteroides sp.]
MNTDEKLNTLYRVASNITFDKATAQKFVGGRRRIEKLISQNKVRAVKTGSAKMSRYSINACDVLLYTDGKREP